MNAQIEKFARPALTEGLARKTSQALKPETPIGLAPVCPRCGGGAVLVSRTANTGRWRCWDWRCREIFETRNTWPRRKSHAGGKARFMSALPRELEAWVIVQCPKCGGAYPASMAQDKAHPQALDCPLCGDGVAEYTLVWEARVGARGQAFKLKANDMESIRYAYRRLCAGQLECRDVKLTVNGHEFDPRGSWPRKLRVTRG